MALTICLGTAASTSPLLAQKIFDEYEDDFSRDNGPADGWTVASGDWQILEERLYIPKGGEQTIWLGEPPAYTLDEFEIEFTMDWPHWDGASMRHGGVVFFADAPTNRFAANCYTVDWLDGSGVRTYRWNPPGAANGVINAVLTPQPVREWKITVVGDIIRVIGDGQLLYEVTDSTFRDGHFAFWNHGGTAMAIDNFILTEPACEPDDGALGGTEFECDDGIDNDCDDSVDADDLDCCLMFGNDEPGFESTCDDGVDNDCDGLKDGEDSDCCFPVANGIEEECTDGLDNDCDSMIDRADVDCCLEVETFCEDGIDDDCDGTADHGDFDCCVAEGDVEEDCDDGIDNDCDRMIDCDDRDCHGTFECPHETDCNNGLDEDADFLVDCVDDDCFNQPPCAVTEFVDNFEDGKLDNWTIWTGLWDVVDGALFLDVGGAESHIWMGDPPVLLPENFTITFDLEFSDWDQTTNVGRHGGAVLYSKDPTTRSGQNYTVDWIDRGGDHGIRVFRDLQAALAPGTPEPVEPPLTWTIEFDGAFLSVYADGEFLVGRWEDQEHRTGHFGFWNYGQHSGLTIDNVSLRQLCKPVAETETNCENGIDDDCDGTTDSEDPDCGCVSTEEAETSCNDGEDNDCDDTVDCRDSDCVDNASCVEVCDDGEDNDADGKFDCEDDDCVGNEACVEVCDDGQDNDFDGDFDCEDDDCKGHLECPTETDCGNGVDDDFDFFIDCEDEDCFNQSPCAVTEFFDDFDDGELDNWTIWAGEWDVVDDALFLGIGGSDLHIWMGDPPLLLPENFTITFDLEFSDWNQNTDPGRHGGAVLFSQTPTTRNGQNYTVDWIDRGGDHGIRVFRNLTVPLAPGTPEPVDPPLTWTIEFDGAFLSVYADEEFLVGRWEDQELRTGHFGFWNYGANSGLTIDNVSLSQLCEPVADTETGCDDGVDNDCDGTLDCADSDCVGNAVCVEVCDDGEDNDADGNVDCADSDCVGNAACVEVCDDGKDNDADGNVDCADADCEGAPACPSGIGPFLRGDCDGNGQVGGSPTEAIVLLNFAFRGGAAPGCLAACDAEANGSIGITDALRILRHSFLGMGEPDAPFPECVASTLESDETLGCETPNDC